MKDEAVDFLVQLMNAKLMFYAAAIVVAGIGSGFDQAMAQGQEKEYLSRADLNHSCATNYLVLALSPNIAAAIGNLGEINAEERSNALVSPLDANSVFVTNNAMTIAFGPDLPSTPQQINRFIAALIECDVVFDFTPVIAPRSGATAPTAPATVTISHLDCAAAYWLMGALVERDRPAALQRVGFAVEQHLSANPRDSRPAVEQRVVESGHGRGESEFASFRNDLAEANSQLVRAELSEDDRRVWQRRRVRAQESLGQSEQRLQADVNACDAQYSG